MRHVFFTNFVLLSTNFSNLGVVMFFYHVYDTHCPYVFVLFQTLLYTRFTHSPEEHVQDRKSCRILQWHTGRQEDRLASKTIYSSVDWISKQVSFYINVVFKTFQSHFCTDLSSVCHRLKMFTSAANVNLSCISLCLLLRWVKNTKNISDKNDIVCNIANYTSIKHLNHPIYPASITF